MFVKPKKKLQISGKQILATLEPHPCTTLLPAELIRQPGEAKAEARAKAKGMCLVADVTCDRLLTSLPSRSLALRRCLCVCMCVRVYVRERKLDPSRKCERDKIMLTKSD